ncbi:MAG TPA: peptidyl-prolyl cis-trans isomerase [Bryobacteraceae bacterium]|jgi:parvulin-like peptidyl-prolyl isomerase
MLVSVAAQGSRTPVIEVNGETIYGDEIRTRMAVLRAEAESASGRELTAEERFALRPQAIEDLIDRLLLRQEAVRLRLQPAEAEIDVALASVAPKYDGSEGCRADAADMKSREDIRARMMVDKLLARWFDSARPPKIHEIREFYRKNQDSFHTPELIAASHIVKQGEGETEASLAAVREAILAGEDFAAASKRFSDCPENAGDLGYFPRGVMVDEFDAVAFATPVGEISAPFRTQFGWHIVHVRDRKPEGIRTFDEVAPQIQNRMLRERQERMVGEKLHALRSGARYVELGRL